MNQYAGQQPGADVDPLMETGQKTPALSFKNAPVGTTRTLWVDSWAKVLQQRDYDTGQPDFWPPDPVTGERNPKMAVVYNGLDEQGNPSSVWAGRPSAMLTALQNAQTASGQRIAPGSRLDITFSSQDESRDPKKEGIKRYAAVHTPQAWVPQNNAPSDPLAGQQPPAAPAQQYQAPPQAGQPPFQAPQRQADGNVQPGYGQPPFQQGAGQVPPAAQPAAQFVQPQLADPASPVNQGWQQPQGQQAPPFQAPQGQAPGQPPFAAPQGQQPQGQRPPFPQGGSEQYQGTPPY